MRKLFILAGIAAGVLLVLGIVIFFQIRSQKPEVLLDRLAAGKGDRNDLMMRLNLARGDVVGPMLEGLRKLGDFRLMVLPDHPTPISLKTHARDPVPYIIYDSRRDGATGKAYDESSMAHGFFIGQGYRLMDLFINGKL